MPRSLVFMLPLAAFLAAGIAPATAKTLRAVASFTVLADVVRQVGGDHVVVRSLVPPNGDPHEFEPSPDDARALKEADIAFTSGEGLETWFARLAKAAGAKEKPVVASAGVATIKMEEDGKTVTDPHVWNDPANVAVWTQGIQRALTAADPDDAAAFQTNGDRYRAELAALAAEAHAKIDSIPRERRKVLTSHDAFGYFAKAYGVTFLSPLGVSTEAEASAQDIAKLIGQIRKENVKVYFLENSNDPRLVKQVAAATGAVTGGALYVESLSAPDGPAPTYAAMFRRNVTLMAEAMSQ